jgi:hypothetical protein
MNRATATMSGTIRSLDMAVERIGNRGEDRGSERHRDGAVAKRATESTFQRLDFNGAIPGAAERRP